MSLVTVGAELLAAKQRLQIFKNNVTVFGSARIKSTDPLYNDAYELGKSLSNIGYNVFTGGGPGIMSAANKGAYEGKSKSIGLNIVLPQEQSSNPYLDENILLTTSSLGKLCLSNTLVLVFIFLEVMELQMS